MNNHTELETDNTHTHCFANRHMTPEEYGVWDVCRSVSHKTGTLYFDGRTIAGYFADTGKDAIYRIVKSLVKKGWLLVQVAGRNTRNGLYVPTQYQVLSPEQWAEDHPHESLPSDPEESSREIQTGSLTEQGHPVEKSRLVQSGIPEQPVEISRTASLENETGPVWNSRTTSLENQTYSAKEISLVCDSAVLNSAEENTEPSIPLLAPRENPRGWLAGCVSSILERETATVSIPSRDEVRELNALADKHGDLAVLLAFCYFVDRDKTLTGVAWPFKLFFKESDAWLRHAVKELDEDEPADWSVMYVWTAIPAALRAGRSRESFHPICKLAEQSRDLVDDYLTHHRLSAQVAADIEKFNAIRDAGETAA